MTNAEPLTYERDYAIRLVRIEHFPFITLRPVLTSYLLAAPPGISRYNAPPIPIGHHPQTNAVTPPPAVDPQLETNAVTQVTAFSKLTGAAV